MKSTQRKLRATLVALVAANLSSFVGIAAAKDSSPESGSTGAAISTNAAKTIDAAIEEQIRTGKTVGIAIQVTQDGKPIISKGYGKANLEWDAPVTPNTVFRIASNTKTFTAACILILVEQGKLTLDDKLSRFLPEFPRADEVTIRHLLTHTAGVANYTRFYTRREDFLAPKTTREMIDLIVRVDPPYDFSPGTAYNYSNSGYYILGYIVEKISGVTLGDFMQEHIFRKLGLNDTAMDKAEDIVHERAGGYEIVSGAHIKFENTTYYPYTFPGPAGGLRSTVVDLAKWHTGLVNGKVIGPKLFAEMVTRAKTLDGKTTSQAALNPSQSDQFDYGYGIRMGELSGHRFYTHSGNIGGFSSFVQTFPDERITIALLTNTGQGLAGLNYKIAELLFGKQP